MNSVLIKVRKSGHNNLATVRGWSIQASCTSDPRMAAQKAAEKLLLRLGEGITFELRLFCTTQEVDTYTCILSKKEEEHAK